MWFSTILRVLDCSKSITTGAVTHTIQTRYFFAILLVPKGLADTSLPFTAFATRACYVFGNDSWGFPDKVSAFFALSSHDGQNARGSEWVILDRGGGRWCM